MTHEIYPCLWFDNEAKSATTFYCECFHPSKIMDENSIALNFSIWDFKFLALNGGPYFKINPSISFFVHHDSDEALTTLWKKLSEGGTVMMALDKYPWSEKYGWCQDKYGVNWQLMLQPGGKEKITPSLMFTQANAGKANEAIEFYTRIFKDSEIEDISRYEKGEHDVEGYIKYSQFRLGNKTFSAMDSSGPHQFIFNEGVSLVVPCNTQEEIDYYWEELSAGGSEGQCGWLKDKFGVSWQIVPQSLGKLMSDKERQGRVMPVLMKMKKLEIEKLENA